MYFSRFREEVVERCISVVHGPCNTGVSLKYTFPSSQAFQAPTPVRLAMVLGVHPKPTFTLPGEVSVST
jgi:hypothetical protein